MTSDWWPRPLAHIAAENPWAGDQVVVAEVKSYDEQPHAGQRRTFSALVPIDEIEAVKASLAKLNHDVSTSGPQPFFSKDRAFCPRFWVGAQELPSDEYEPLVLCWISHDKTVLQLDPGFLMTYGLVQRPGKGGTVYWDDPRTPRHDIAIVSAPSVLTFPVGSHAYVSIAKDYLQDFLTLRHMALVQVFWEIRWGHLDDEMLAILGDNEGVNIDLSDRRYQLGRSMERTASGFAQVWAARVIAMPGGLPVTADPLDDNGLVWPGFDRPITNEVSRSLGLNDYFYVDDTVLAAYEGTPGFKINPESGSVSYGNQWSVGGARVGRNLLRLEPKGLYEGAPPEAVRHWHEYAVAPIPMSAYPAILEVPNIATRAKKIAYAVASLGEALSALAQKAGLDDLTPEAFVSLRRAALDYHGWWTFETPEAAARHVPENFAIDPFLDRCMSLDKLVIEGLSEARLRSLLRAIGVPADPIRDFRTLKLLDAVVRMAQSAEATGLELPTEGTAVWDRLATEGTQPAQPIAHLFALHDTRILKAHKASDRTTRVQTELERFGVTPGEEAPGYGLILDHIYDVLADEVASASAKIAAAT